MSTKITVDNIANNSVGITQLNVSDGSNGQFLTTDGAGNLSFSTASGTTINNNADNRVITGSGTANTLEGESNFVFDSTNSRVGINNPSPDATLSVGSGQSNYVRIDNATSGDVSSGYQVYSGSTLTTQLYGNADEGWTTLLSGGAINFRVNNASSGFNPMGIDTSGRVTMPYQPAFCVYNPAGTYPTNANEFGKNAAQGNYSTYVNVGSHFSTSTGRFTAPIAGNYYFSFSAMFDSNTASSPGFDFRINGTAQNGGEGLSSGTATYEQLAGSIISTCPRTS